MKNRQHHGFHHRVILQWYLMPLLFILNGVLADATYLNAFAGQPTVDNSCCECHNDIFTMDSIKSFVHLPFLQQKCPICHVLNNPTADNAVMVNVPNHLPMRCTDEICSSVCTECHTNFSSDGNHPLKVHPSIKVIIPAEYKTNSEGGLNCITCHANHASDFRFRTVKSYKKSLCVGCHKGYPAPIGPPAFSLIKSNL